MASVWRVAAMAVMSHLCPKCQDYDTPWLDVKSLVRVSTLPADSLTLEHGTRGYAVGRPRSPGQSRRLTSGAWENDNSTDVSRAMVLQHVDRLRELADSTIDALRRGRGYPLRIAVTARFSPDRSWPLQIVLHVGHLGLLGSSMAVGIMALCGLLFWVEPPKTRDGSGAGVASDEQSARSDEADGSYITQVVWRRRAPEVREGPRIVSAGEPCASRAGPRQGECDGLDARGSKRIDAIIWSSSARSVADAPGRDIVSITSRWPSTSRMYTALRIPPP